MRTSYLAVWEPRRLEQNENVIFGRLWSYHTQRNLVLTVKSFSGIQFRFVSVQYGGGIAQRSAAWAAGIHSQQEQDTFLFSTASRSALEPTQSLIQWVLGGGGSFPGCKVIAARKSPLTSKLISESRIVELRIRSPIRHSGGVFSFVKHRNNFTYISELKKKL
jgi:hypothetical protein